ncbi:MAG: hypothetical protein ACKESA_00695 [Candidatus Hodgkinia cicadicola]
MIRLHLLLYTSFNVDLNRDQMAVHMPLSLGAL